MWRFQDVQPPSEMSGLWYSRDVLGIKAFFYSFSIVLVRFTWSISTERFICHVCLIRQLFSSCLWKIKVMEHLTLFLVPFQQDLIVLFILIRQYFHPWALIIPNELVCCWRIVSRCLMSHFSKTCWIFTCYSRVFRIFLLQLVPKCLSFIKWSYAGYISCEIVWGLTKKVDCLWFSAHVINQKVFVSVQIVHKLLCVWKLKLVVSTSCTLSCITYSCILTTLTHFIQINY